MERPAVLLHYLLVDEIFKVTDRRCVTLAQMVDNTNYEKPKLTSRSRCRAVYDDVDDIFNEIREVSEPNKKDGDKVYIEIGIKQINWLDTYLLGWDTISK